MPFPLPRLICRLQNDVELAFRLDVEGRVQLAVLVAKYAALGE